MKIKFLDVAKEELDETIIYYENESSGLGERFLGELLEALDRIGCFRAHGILALRGLGVI